MLIKKSFIYQSLVAITAGLAITAIVAFAWTEPSTAPPGGNVSAPLNVGNVGQSKSGGLILGTGCVPPCTTGLIVDKGNVGIGTATPAAKLQVNSDIQLGSTGGYPLVIERNEPAAMDAYIWHNARWASGYVTGSLQDTWLTTHGSFGSRGIAMSYANGITFYADNAATTQGSIFTPTARMVIMNNGSVGIGTTTPASTLDVYGGILDPGTGNYTVGRFTNNGSANIKVAGNMGNTYLGIDTNGDAYIGGLSNPVARNLRIFAGNTESMRISSTGNVGIGTTLPAEKLDVNGIVKIQNFRIGQVSATELGLYDSSLNLIVIFDSGI